MSTSRRDQRNDNHVKYLIDEEDLEITVVSDTVVVEVLSLQEKYEFLREHSQGNDNLQNRLLSKIEKEIKEQNQSEEDTFLNFDTVYPHGYEEENNNDNFLIDQFFYYY